MSRKVNFNYYIARKYNYFAIKPNYSYSFWGGFHYIIFLWDDIVVNIARQV